MFWRHSGISTFLQWKCPEPQRVKHCMLAFYFIQTWMMKIRLVRLIIEKPL